MKIRLSIVIFITLVVAAATYSSQEESYAAGGEFPEGHSYTTYTITERGPGYEATVYVDETYPHANGVPLLVTKSWIEGFEPNFQSKPLCPSSPEQAQHWWGDRGKMHLSGGWSSFNEGDRTAWVYSGEAQQITARFGILQVDGGDIIGGESAHRPEVTARCISPITGDMHVSPPPPDVNKLPAAEVCVQDVSEIVRAVGGSASDWTQHSEREWVYAGGAINPYVPEGYEMDTPHGKITGPNHVNNVDRATLRCQL